MREQMYDLDNTNSKKATMSRFLANVTERNYIIGVLTSTGTVSVSVNPVFHTYEIDASTEAKRLASLNLGSVYVVLQLKGAFVATGITAY